MPEEIVGVDGNTSGEVRIESVSNEQQPADQQTDPFVPPDAKEHFDTLADVGEYFGREVDSLKQEEQKQLKKAFASAATGAAGIAATFGGAFTFNPVVTAVGLGAMVGGAAKAIYHGHKANKLQDEGNIAKIKSASAFAKTRGIVKRELKRTGAEYNEFGELTVTNEQIEKAHAEMERALVKKKEEVAEQEAIVKDIKEKLG